MAAHPATPFTPAQEARIREIVAEMIGQWSAGADARIFGAMKAAIVTAYPDIDPEFLSKQQS